VLTIFTVISAFAILFMRTYSFLSKINETVEAQNLQIKNDRDEIDRLLSNILPNPIIHRLRAGEFPIADQFECVTVLFADIVGFTQWAGTMNPLDLVTTLDQIFSEFDELVSFYNLEKIKTIGDAYMVVGGVPDVNAEAMKKVVEMALVMQQQMQKMSSLSLRDPMQVRIGIHAGPLVAGIIGNRKFAYDLWGDTVNIASRMESYGLPGKIHCSETIYEALKDVFYFEKRSPIEVRGKGTMQTYFLLGSQ
jgi:class 3 adenylate cyclase